MVLTPFEFQISGTVDYKEPGYPDETFTEHTIKKGPSNGRVVSCTFSQTFEDDYVIGTLSGTVIASYTR